ncbi:hypothetical protein C2845_PM04G09880 [Panicum miliaceum]|uniref:Dehydrodolichyl diphosphate synthase 2-like n=1 Tax=Panicum miliaceum TaxID=4540 RepID=A0A3L6QX50_PANMI|nr:hypothetical protein C2845_PM04G09880 [Panicum miliaceum]
MDGNTRWARARGLTPADRHTAGGRNLEQIVVGLSRAWGVRAVTAFVCSESLRRPKARPRQRPAPQLISVRSAKHIISV